jgi:hypothetical protein
MLGAEIQTYLAGLGLGTIAGSSPDIVVSQLIDDPDHLIAIFPYAAEPPEFDHDSDLPTIEHPGLQIIVRDADFDTAMAAAYDVHGALCAVKNTTLSGTLYQRITPKHSPAFLQRDESQRTLIACNYRVSKELSAS